MEYDLDDILDKITFTATLKTLDDKVVEYGTATLSTVNRSIDFESEFVPIFTIGTPLKLVRTEGETEVQVFTGETYLSSQTLIRLVSLTDEILPGAAYAIPCDIAMEGTGKGITQSSRKPFKKFMNFLICNDLPKEKNFPININSICLSSLTFTCKENIEEGERLYIDTSYPIILKDMPVTVTKAFIFGNDENCGYKCSIDELSGRNYEKLSSMLQRTSYQKLKIFRSNPFSPEKENS